MKVTYNLPASGENALAVLGATVAAELVLLLVEVVVVRQLVACRDIPLRAYDNMLSIIDSDDLGAAVAVAAVVQVAGLAAVERRVDDLEVVNPEHVAVADAALLVLLLADVRHLVRDDLADILDDDVVLLEVLAGEEADAVDL